MSLKPIAVLGEPAPPPIEDTDWDASLSGEESLPPSANDLRPVLFEPTRRAASATLQADIEDLTAYLLDLEATLGLRQRKRTQKALADFRLAVEALACNALVVALYGEGQLLAVPRANGTMWDSMGTGAPVYGQHFLDALALFARPEVGFVEDVARGYSFTGSKGQLSTIRVLAAFREALGAGPHDWESLRRDDARSDVIFLRDAKKGNEKPKDLTFPDTKQRKAERNAVLKLNAWFAQAPLIITASQTETLRDGSDQPVDPSNRSLRRIFNNRSWQQGGRLFGGFWQTMRRDDRFSHLRVGTPEHPEGEPIVSVDYDQLFPRIAYHRVQTAQPDGDLYAVMDPIDEDAEASRNQRKGIKRVFNSLLFTKGEMTHWPRDTAPLFPKGTKLATVRNAIYDHHPALRKLFGTGIGFSLMHSESEALLHVLRDLHRRNVVALPIHDAVLVARSHAEEAKTAMTTAIQERLGLDLRVTISGPQTPAP